MTDYTIPVFHTFTREFYHPNDSVQRASAAAAERFRADHRRFPATAYEQNSVVWRGDQWRQLDHSERSILHGMPPAMAESIQTAGSDEKATATRNSAVGNGFHVPSVMLALIVLFQMLPQGQAIKFLPEPRELELSQRIRDTAFDDYLVDRFPGLLSARCLVADMRQQLPMLTECWKEVGVNLNRLNLRRLQRFWVFLKLHGHTGTEAGPEWAMQRQRALA